MSSEAKVLKRLEELIQRTRKEAEQKHDVIKSLASLVDSAHEDEESAIRSLERIADNDDNKRHEL